MNKTFFIIAGLLLFITSFAPPAPCEQSQSRYVTLKYGSKEILRKFNEELDLTSSLTRVMRKNTVTMEDEVLAKVDIIVEKAESVLDMFPNNLHMTLILLPSSADVARAFYQKYQKNVNYLSFYSLSEKTIYISVDDTNLHVVAHEISHAIVDHFFDVRPPYNIHELMAQFTEKHITD
jgi:predicted RND superfamily exporter protein